MKAKERKTVAAVKALPARERAKVRGAMRTLGRAKIGPCATLEAGQDIVLAYERLRRKRGSDTATDARRRVLVGARVPRSMYERCRAAADGQGVSLYVWVMQALLAALQEEGGGNG